MIKDVIDGRVRELHLEKLVFADNESEFLLEPNSLLDFKYQLRTVDELKQVHQIRPSQRIVFVESIKVIFTEAQEQNGVIDV